MVRRINKSLFNLCRERYNKIAGKVQKLQFIYVIYGRMKELTEQGRVNKTAMTGHTIMGILLALVNFLEIFKTSKNVVYVAVLIVLALGPVVAEWICYRKDQETKAIKHLLGIGFAVYYTVALIGAGNQLVFVYVIPMFILISVFSDSKYALELGIGATIVNLISIVVHTMKGQDEGPTFYGTEIIILILTTAFSYCSSAVLQKSFLSRLGEMNQAKGQSDTMLQKILEVSDAMTKRINGMSDEVELLGSGVSDTRNAMEELTGGTTDTAEAVQNQLSQTEAIQEKVMQVTRASGSIAESMAVTAEALNAGKKNIEQLVSQVSVTEQTNSQVAAELTSLKEYMDKMYSIIEIINNITSETSLLSLNASIEAARAGEAGRGFAVVASEISGLATQTQEATVSIEELIRNVSEELEKVVTIIESMISQVEHQNVTVNETAGSFRTIEDNSGRVQSQSDALSGIVKELESANAGIMDSIQTISAISEEVAAHTNNTLTTCEKNQKSVEHLMAETENLIELTHQLQQ